MYSTVRSKVLTGELLQQVAPRPLPTSMLYDDQGNYTMQHATRETTN